MDHPVCTLQPPSHLPPPPPFTPGSCRTWQAQGQVLHLSRYHPRRKGWAPHKFHCVRHARTITISENHFVSFAAKGDGIDSCCRPVDVSRTRCVWRQRHVLPCHVSTRSPPQTQMLLAENVEMEYSAQPVPLRDEFGVVAVFNIYIWELCLAYCESMTLKKEVKLMMIMMMITLIMTKSLFFLL